MYSIDIRAAEIQARQDFFYQQGRIDRQLRASRRTRIQGRLQGLLHDWTVRVPGALRTHTR